MAFDLYFTNDTMSTIVLEIDNSSHTVISSETIFLETQRNSTLNVISENKTVANLTLDPTSTQIGLEVIWNGVSLSEIRLCPLYLSSNNSQENIAINNADLTTFFTNNTNNVISVCTSINTCFNCDFISVEPNQLIKLNTEAAVGNNWCLGVLDTNNVPITISRTLNNSLIANQIYYNGSIRVIREYYNCDAVVGNPQDESFFERWGWIIIIVVFIILLGISVILWSINKRKQ
jgi:hypothetical protein